MREFNARLVYYWSKVRQALKSGSVVEAAEWIDSAGRKEGAAMTLALKERVGQLCRGEIER